MYTVRYGGKKGPKVTLVPSPDHVVVRTANRAALPLTPISLSARRALVDFEPVVQFAHAGVEVLRATGRAPRSRSQAARAVLKKERTIQFAGRVLVDRVSRQPVIYTENFFVKFYDDESAAACRRVLAKYKLSVRRQISYARNAYFVAAREGTGQKVFTIADRLLNEPAVELSHPELVREMRWRAVFPGQWHLRKMTIDGKVVDAHAGVETAWPRTRGERTTIAIIDTGIDVDHEEFSAPGKVVAPRDATRETGDARPGGARENHGTACAGVACADGRFGASGVAPAARLMPIRLMSALGSQQEADAFVWAADHGADIISCSWGPNDGKWWDPKDPEHDTVVPLPDSTRLAIEYALTHGRNGRGCVITWAAGNGNESVANDGYASHPAVIAVAACNDSGKRSAYSDFGPAVWCAFPSNDGVPSKTPGIFTTDRTGAPGYNPGRAALGSVEGDYTNDFGGTSSAAPGVAGVAALVLSRNPNLRHDEVKDIVKRACERIDAANGNYDASGHSPLYGYGRLNARRAVDLALPGQPQTVAVRSTVQDVAIRDFKTARLSVPVADTAVLTGIKVRVDIDHTYIGDLLVTLRPPTVTGVKPVVLHNRAGGGADNLKTSYDPVNAPGLAALIGKKPTGTWVLSVADREAADTGMLHSVTLELSL